MSDDETGKEPKEDGRTSIKVDASSVQMARAITEVNESIRNRAEMIKSAIRNEVATILIGRPDLREAYEKRLRKLLDDLRGERQ